MNKTENNCIRDCANVELINQSISDLSQISMKISKTSKILNLIGNETRLKILYLIKKERKICVCDMSDILDISVSAISQQLKKLKEAHLLTSVKKAQTIYYHIHPISQEVIDHVFEIFKKELIIKVA
ncbi:MAG: winged helix-turn-helix transcriptional regulator [Fluviicola sp.]|nr:winged helix-turn-helix transcriptional regulator [Fluviicola sp.]